MGFSRHFCRVDFHSSDFCSPLARFASLGGLLPGFQGAILLHVSGHSQKSVGFQLSCGNFD